MRLGSDALKDVLKGSFTVEYTADVFYGSTRTVENLPIVSPSFKWDSEATTAATGSCLVKFTPEFAESMTPNEFTDKLAPFGAELNVRATVSGGDFSETVQVGRYVIKAVPSAKDEFMQFMGSTIVSGSHVELTLADRSLRVIRWGFRTPQNPPSLTSCWNEIARISGAAVLKNVADKPIPTSIVYEANSGGRWKAVQQLAGVLGGKAYFNPFGVLTILPDTPDGVVGELVLGESGTIIDVDYSMDSDGVVNEVVGNFEDELRNPIYSVASIGSGRLAAGSQYGTYTEYFSSPLIKTQDAADRAVQTRLFNLSSQQTYRVPVQCILNPLIQFGDVVTLERPDRTLEGRVVNLSNGGDGLMSLELEVARPVL